MIHMIRNSGRGFSLLVCKGAKADVVFLIDGSWSIGDESFSKVVQFVFSVVGAFDVIGPSGMQVMWLTRVKVLMFL